MVDEQEHPSIISLLYKNLYTEKAEKEILLELILNTQLSSSTISECNKLLKEITLINESILTLDNYLN